VSTKRSRSLKQESLAENKELGLEHVQEKFDIIFAVLRQHNIDEERWLDEYCRACPDLEAVMAGQKPAQAPADFEKFLPWNMPDEMRRRLQKRTIAHL
jgi:hypothetical protein